MVDWSDNFDSYATGSQLHGQGGWKGWDNNPAAGALTSSAQARSAPNSAAIVGASDLVHEYSGYTSGQWVYTAWQYVPTNFTGQSYFILLNTYSDGGTNNWSTQLCFDASAGLVKDDVPGDCSGATGLPLVTGQWVEIRVEIDLTANTQAVYYNNQLLFQDTWTDHVSGGGALNIAAVDLFANNASTVYYDDLSLAAPAQPVACDAPADIPWASVNPTNGTTPGGGSTPVTVTFNSTGLANGIYTGNLCVTSNDPDPGPGNGTDLVIVPLTLTVQPPTAVTLSGLTANASQSPVAGRHAAGRTARSRRPGNGGRLRTAAQAVIAVPQTSEVFRSEDLGGLCQFQKKGPVSEDWTFLALPPSLRLCVFALHYGVIDCTLGSLSIQQRSCL